MFVDYEFLKDYPRFIKDKVTLVIDYGDSEGVDYLARMWPWNDYKVIGCIRYVKDAAILNKRFECGNYMVLKPERDKIPVVDTIIVMGIGPTSDPNELKKVVNRCLKKCKHLMQVKEKPGERDATRQVYYGTRLDDGRVLHIYRGDLRFAKKG